MARSMNRPLVVCVGEVLWDCFPDRKALGGAPLNVAYVAGALGAEAVMVSRVGDDADGEQILAAMKKLGVDTRFVQRDALHATGTVKVQVSPAGEPTFTIVENAAYDYIQWDEALEEVLDSCDAVCFGTLAQRNRVSRESILRMVRAATRAARVYDVNLRGKFCSRDILRDGLALARIVKVNDGELAALKELFPTEWKNGPEAFMRYFGIALLAVMRGAEGCVLRRGGAEEVIPGVKVPVTDAAGSGDAFTASLILSWLQGKSLREMGREANLLGAYLATQRGATPPIRKTAIDKLRREAYGA